MTWVQKCDTFRDMDGEEGPVQETAWGALHRGVKSPQSTGTLRRAGVEVTLQDSPGALLCHARGSQLFHQHSQVLKPAKVPPPAPVSALATSLLVPVGHCLVQSWR